MAFVKYENLHTPDEVIEKMHEYVGTTGNQISDALREDTNIYQRDGVDGKRFTFQDKNKEYFVNLRSANGTQIFGTNDDAEMDLKTKEKHKGYHGVGMVVSEGFSKTQRWYNQFNVPKKFKDKKVLGAWMPVSTGYEDLEEVPKPAKVDEPTPMDTPQLRTSEIVIPPDGSNLPQPYKEYGSCLGDWLDESKHPYTYYTNGDSDSTYAKQRVPRGYQNLTYGMSMGDNKVEQNKYIFWTLVAQLGDPDLVLLKHFWNKHHLPMTINPNTVSSAQMRAISQFNAGGFNQKGVMELTIGDMFNKYGNDVVVFLSKYQQAEFNGTSFAKPRNILATNPDYYDLPDDFFMYFASNRVQEDKIYYGVPKNLYFRNANGSWMPLNRIEFNEYGVITNGGSDLINKGSSHTYYMTTRFPNGGYYWGGGESGAVKVYETFGSVAYPIYLAWMQKQDVEDFDFDSSLPSSVGNYYDGLMHGYDTLFSGVFRDGKLVYTGVGQGQYHVKQYSMYFMSKKIYEKMQNAPSMDEYYAKYKDCLANIDSGFSTIYGAWEVEKARMKKEHDDKEKEKAAENEKFRNEYNSAMELYNTYLKKKEEYNKYLGENAKYKEYLDKKAKLENVYDLYCNHITAPTELLTFSLVKRNKNDERYFQTTHLIFGMLNKYEAWNGGAFFSGSANQDMMQTAYQIYVDDDKISDRWTLPVLSSSALTNTYLRIDVDEAPLDIRGNVIWASSGHDNITGKSLALPIRNNDTDGAKIPSYYFMQSKERLDWGRNINTLNGITVDMPMFFAVKTDPEELNLYAAVGQATGIYFISMLNMQTAGTYERSYPKSGVLNQVFPMGRRRGNYGFDGIGIAQEETVDIAP